MKHWIAASLTAFAGAALVAALAAAAALAGGTQAGAKVALAKSPLGGILVDSKGITLYDFVKDKRNVSSCYGACAALWPPLLTKAKPVAARSRSGRSRCHCSSSASTASAATAGM